MCGCVCVCVFLIVLDAPASKQFLKIRPPPLQNPGSAYEQRHTLLEVKPIVQSKHLNFVCLNIRSLKNKTTSLFDFIVSHNLDVLALTETWLCNGDNIILNKLFPPNH